MPEYEEIKIRPARSLRLNFREIWQNRELLYFFVWRDVKVKYKQTILGIGWALLQPLLLMILSYFIFFRTLHVESGMNYPVFAFSGLILWSLFSNGITNSSESLLSNAPIIRKIYFPRMLVPLSALFTAMVDFLFGFLLLIGLLLFFHQPVSWTACYYFPAGIIVTLLASFGLGTLLSAMNVKYRDFRYLLPFLMQLLFFGSQTIYALRSVKTGWMRDLFYLNPLNGALELFRAPFGITDPYWTGIGISLIVLFVLLLAGLSYFKKTEAYFADLI